MTTESATIVQHLWNYCNTLRDDGVSYGDYVEQLARLLFLRIANEQVLKWVEFGLKTRLITISFQANREEAV